ncbi:hypothetical protein ACFYU9_25700 [Streptomyces sp. NPDC004327]|uniref:hypothetical protein n=1 Tax=Streptomyces sp. NPDC004327 TaxID=3364699 RepID=UPI0036BB7AC1
MHSLPDQVEAAVRSDRAADAGRAAERFTRLAEVTGTAWAGELRCRALLAADDARAEEARTRLLYGSPRTVGYHLSNAYSKLGVAPRAALGALDWADVRSPRRPGRPGSPLRPRHA